MDLEYFDVDDHRQPTPAVIAHRERWRKLEAIAEGTSTEKRRHHFVPRMWLRNWADPATEQIEVLDVTEKRGFAAGISKVMVVSDLYRVGVEVTQGTDMGPEEAFSRIEGAAADAMNAVLAGTGLTDAGRYALALLIALQHVRVPAVIASAVPADPHGLRPAVDAFTERLLAEPDGPPPPHMKQSAYGRSSHELANELVDGFALFNRIERGFGFWNLLNASHHIAGRIYQRQWTVVSPETILLLCDDPVAVEPLGNTTVRVKGKISAWDTPVPIGPRTLLLIGNRPDGSGPIEPDLNDWYAGISNELQIRRAHRFIIGPAISTNISVSVKPSSS